MVQTVVCVELDNACINVPSFTSQQNSNGTVPFIFDNSASFYVLLKYLSNFYWNREFPDWPMLFRSNECIKPFP